MRKFKRLSAMVSVLLCLSMVFGMSSVFAEGSNESQGIYRSYDFATKTWSETPMPKFDPTLTSIPPTGDLVPNPDDIAPHGYIEGQWQQVTNTGAKPYKAIAQLKITYEDGTTATGSAFAVSAGKVLTAGHCILGKSGSIARDITLYFGRNGTNTYMKKTSGSNFTVNSNYDYGRNYDYGILSVPKSVTDYTGTFGLYAGVYASQVYTLTGYPNYKEFANARKLYTHSGTVREIKDLTTMHRLNSCGGVSGSPLYGSNNYAVAIHTGGYNDEPDSDSEATNITSDVINFITEFII